MSNETEYFIFTDSENNYYLLQNPGYDVDIFCNKNAALDSLYDNHLDSVIDNLNDFRKYIWKYDKHFDLETVGKKLEKIWKSVDEECAGNMDLSTLKASFQKVNRYRGGIKFPCSYCGYGETDIYLIKILDGSWAVLNHWCGCLTYSASYEINTFTNKYEAKGHYIKNIRNYLINKVEG